MLVDLAKRFLEQFPDGRVARMRRWSDDKVIKFLTSINGVGKKSALCILMYSLGRKRFPIDAHVRRVLRRTGLVAELYREESEKEHRVFQAEVEELVPPSTRIALHTGLLSVGKEYCRPRSPRCDACPIRSMCSHFHRRKLRLAEGRRFTHVELFSGAGGFGVGFQQEGFRTVLAVDKDHYATRTYRLNHPAVPGGNVLAADLEKVRVAKLRRLIECWRHDALPGRVHVLTAGLPCQGFSKAGYRSRPHLKYKISEDPRNHLYKTIVAWTKYLRPRYVVIENVPGMRSAGTRSGTILRSLRRAVERLGYRVDAATMNAADFGVPQRRRRLLVVANHPKAPALTLNELDQFRSGQRLPLRAAIGDLPRVRANAGSWYMRVNGTVLVGHRCRFNNEEDLRIFGAIRPGERYVDFVARRGDILRDRQRIGSSKVYSTRSFADKFYRLLQDEPARTIVAHLQRDGNGYIHPTQARSITPREAARIQGFGDDFVFTGRQGAQFIQIGNAVPPRLAQLVARVIARKLRGASR